MYAHAKWRDGGSVPCGIAGLRLSKAITRKRVEGVWFRRKRFYFRYNNPERKWEPVAHRRKRRVFQIGRKWHRSLSFSTNSKLKRSNSDFLYKLLDNIVFDIDNIFRVKIPYTVDSPLGWLISTYLAARICKCVEAHFPCLMLRSTITCRSEEKLAQPVKQFAYRRVQLDGRSARYDRAS